MPARFDGATFAPKLCYKTRVKYDCHVPGRSETKSSGDILNTTDPFRSLQKFDRSRERERERTRHHVRTRKMVFHTFDGAALHRLSVLADRVYFLPPYPISFRLTSWETK